MQLYNDLEEQIRDRTARLNTDRDDLKAFCFSVSHDLQAPLRRIEGFSRQLLERPVSRVDDIDREYIRRIRRTNLQMRHLVDDLLMLSRITRADITRETVDLTRMAGKIAAELRSTATERQVEFIIDDGITAIGDPRLLRVAMENLLSNAWKFTTKRSRARIEFGCTTDPEQQRIYCIKDNGAGFDMFHIDKLFKAFQRLHSDTEFPGAGVGLTTVQRIIQKHGGRVWGHATHDMGATFYFTLE